MTLEHFEEKELDSLESASKVLGKLLENRLKDIKEDDFKLRVMDVEGMLKREFNRGTASAYDSILNLGETIKEERELREKERLAQEKKT